MTENLNQTNILLCGSSRVGKSTLINAICQEKLAKTSASLNSQTQTIDRYSYQFSNGVKSHETIVWDAPGIESWHENAVQDYMTSLIKKTKPLCMIYCASPGSFAQLRHVQWLIAECYRRRIFCALVCTNMWAGRNRQEIVDGFKQIVSAVHPTITPTIEDRITYYGKVALVTMVNSVEYVDDDFNVRKAPEGVEELIFGIGRSLQRELMFAWFKSMSKNKSFWSRMSSKLNNLIKLPVDKLNALLDGVSSAIDFLLELDGIYEDEKQDSPVVSETPIFHDAEMIETQEATRQNQVTFTFQSEDIDMAAVLSKALSVLGARSCKTEPINKPTGDSWMMMTVEFEQPEQVEALCIVWQQAAANICKLSTTDE